MYPQLVAERAHELSIWKDYLPTTRYVGEVSLDEGRRFCHSFEKQRVVFEHVRTACADARGKILSVHSGRCAKTVLDMIETKLPIGVGQVVLHWVRRTNV